MENGTWAPSAAKTMKSILEKMQNVEICDTVVTIKTTMNNQNIEEMNKMVDELLK